MMLIIHFFQEMELFPPSLYHATMRVCKVEQHHLVVRRKKPSTFKKKNKTISLLAVFLITYVNKKLYKLSRHWAKHVKELWMVIDEQNTEQVVSFIVDDNI